MKHELIASATASGHTSTSSSNTSTVIVAGDEPHQLHHLRQHQLQQSFHLLDGAEDGANNQVKASAAATAAASVTPTSASILYGSNVPLPQYPAPVGRRLNWTFREKANSAQDSITSNHHEPTDRHRTLTLDLIPDDAYIVHSPPSALPPTRTPPLSVQPPTINQQQHQQQSHRQPADFAQRKVTPVGVGGGSNGNGNGNGGSMRHSATQRASTLPRLAMSPSATNANAGQQQQQQHHHRTNNHPTVNHQHNHRHSQHKPLAQHTSSAAYMLGLYGWRKRCLFVLICALISLIVMNLALTLWILKVMEFSADGMGSLKVVAGGLQLTGQALVMDMLKASTIRSKHGQPISIESTRNFTVSTRNRDGSIENQLFLGHDRFDVLSHSLQMSDAHGNVVFAADKNEVRIGANVLRVDGDGGVVFRDSVQTPLIRAEPGRELRFESPTRSVHINAGQDVVIKSAAGSLEAACLNDVRLRSEAGNIRLEAASILMPNLRIAQPSTSTSSFRDVTSSAFSSSASAPNKVYQLCACANGKLFLALAHGICAGDEASVCR